MTEKKTDIISYVEELSSFDVALSLPQRTILRAIYGLPMAQDEIALLLKWREAGKTNWTPGRRYRDIFLQAGMRSTKSCTLSLLYGYEFDRLIHLPNPQLAFGVPADAPLYLGLVGHYSASIQCGVFAYLKRHVEQRYRGLIARGIITVSDTAICHHEKKVYVVAAGIHTASSVVGRVMPLIGFEEIAWVEADPYDPHGTTALDAFARAGRASACLKDGRRICVSSALRKGDAMEVLVDENWHRAGALVFDLTTFDMNPMLTRENPIVAHDYLRDEKAAKRDYENVRS